MASDPGRSGRWSYSAPNARAWIQRHPVLGDLLVPVALGALTVRPATGRLAGDSAGLWLSAAACLIPLIWRRDHPIIVFALVTVAAVATAAADFKSLGVTAAGALLVALFTVGAHEPRRRALIAAVIFEAWAVPA